MTLEKVNIYKFKQSVKSFEDCYKGSEELIVFDIPEFEEFEHVEVRGKFKLHESPKNQDNVPWVSFLNSACPDEDRFRFKSINTFPSALVIVKIVSTEVTEFFALTFGLAGDSSMNREKIESDFGILVAMNICDKNGLKRIQTSVHEAISTQSEKQASSGAGLEIFDINEEREIFRSISGFAKKEFNYINSLKGKECISIKLDKKSKVAIDWNTLIKRVHELGEASKSSDYKSIFSFYDRFHTENDKETTEQLDNIVFEQIKAKTFDKVHLSPPEFMDYDRFRFQYSMKESDDKFEDLDIIELRDQKSRMIESSTESDCLKKMKISLWDTETKLLIKNKWNVHKCLVAEAELNDETFILSMGQWKKVSTDFKKEVTDSIEKIEVVDASYLPDDVSIWDTKEEENREFLFNEEAAKNSKLFLFDRKKIKIGDDSRYEVCDLLHCEKKFVHVKRYSSGTASISYLFTQGRFYTDAFIKDISCRSSMKKCIDDYGGSKDKDKFKDILPDDRKLINAENYEIIFCILSDKVDFDLKSLPFMSQYELMYAHSHISDFLGFKCSIVIKRVKLGGKK